MLFEADHGERVANVSSSAYTLTMPRRLWSKHPNRETKCFQGYPPEFQTVSVSGFVGTFQTVIFHSIEQSYHFALSRTTDDALVEYSLLDFQSISFNAISFVRKRNDQIMRNNNRM